MSFLTGISGSFRNFRVTSDNSVNSGTSVITLKFPLQLRVIPGFRNPCFFKVNFRHQEFLTSEIPRKT